MTSFSHIIFCFHLKGQYSIFKLLFLNDYYINKIENLMAFLEEKYETERVF